MLDKISDNATDTIAEQIDTITSNETLSGLTNDLLSDLTSELQSSLNCPSVTNQAAPVDTE